MELQDNWFF